jgi:hypothetical protein
MILKLEPENFDPVTHERRQLWCYAISAKRYTLFNLDDETGRPLVRKYSEHGLGHLLNPTDPPDTEDLDEEDEERRAWMKLLWEGLVTEAFGLPFDWPVWLDPPRLVGLQRAVQNSSGPLRPGIETSPMPSRSSPSTFC